MLIPNISGVREVNVNLSKYKVKWDEFRASGAQSRAKQFFKPWWVADQVCEEFKIPGSRLRIDLINFSKRIVVEISGQQHEKFVKFYHKNRQGFLKSIKRDFKKINWVKNIMGFNFVEVYDSEVDDLSVSYFNRLLEEQNGDEV
jgi:hypothetical protein